MALQGTIDSFAMADVLRLLASSAKSGRLIVNGDRGTVNLWLEEGRFVGGGTPDPSSVEISEVVFDVLRFENGSFIFEAGAVCSVPLEPVEVAPVLGQAEAAMLEWNEIVKIVPSPRSWITLAAELPHPEVVVDQACWASIVAVGSGTSVDQLGSRLGLGELSSSRLVRALVEAGFVEVVDAPEAQSALWHTDLASEDAVSVESEDMADPFGTTGLPDLPIRRPMTAFEDESELPAVSFGGEAFASDDIGLPSLTVAGLSDDLYESGANPADSAGVADVSRSMSMLSSKAAQALASLSLPADAPRTPLEGDDEDEERTRMLRFLGTV